MYIVLILFYLPDIYPELYYFKGVRRSWGAKNVLRVGDSNIYVVEKSLWLVVGSEFIICICWCGGAYKCPIVRMAFDTFATYTSTTLLSLTSYRTGRLRKHISSRC